MKKYFAVLAVTLLIVACGTPSSTNDLAPNTSIKAEIDLINVNNDKVLVTIDPGRFTAGSAIYRLPRIIQGTYDVSNFGSFIENFKAFDYDGNELPVTNLDVNSWVINGAQQLDKITYLVNDTYDIENTSKSTPFSPSGTNIETDNYMLNLHGFVGYFDALKNNQYDLKVISPSDFKRSSALQVISEEKNKTTTTTHYFAPRYFDITDNPMMYGYLDVEEFNVGSIKIVLSVYSPNNVHKASEIKATVIEMMNAQKKYLGDLDATPRYDIFLYLSDTSKDNQPTGFGALEHHTSTVTVLRESSTKERLAESIIDVVSHEFFHIVTPLSVHSEDIHYFDYDQPTFSKHLWLYEGVTEYFAQHFQVFEGLIEPNEYYQTINRQIAVSLQLDDSMSFTKMSENVLEEPYASNYYNVYMKGALIGMCIDILMRENSNGQRSMLSLMKELSAKYGKNKPFDDDSFIAELTEMTYPAIGEFLNTHVVGGTPIDYNVYFEKVGLKKTTGRVKTNFVQNGGNLIFYMNPANGSVYFNQLVRNNSFWNDQGVQSGDVIKTLNGKEVTMQNANNILQEIYGWGTGQEINVILDRNGQEVIIETTTEQSYTEGNTLVEDISATESQKALRKAWLKG